MKRTKIKRRKEWMEKETKQKTRKEQETGPK